jgi:DNA (cytosine-5)-methyltransferase 1
MGERPEAGRGALTFGSVCSGIEAASAAWHPLGWRAAFVSEIEAFPRAVLQHRWPETPLHGDFTTIEAGQYEPIDLLVGGTPCQSFSIAGLRGGLDDERGNLALEYLRLADRLRPRWLVWENVPGVLSSAGGRDFGAILRGMVELGYGFAYRVLDAQFFGVAQRRRRVFVVGYLGDWRRAAAVLFERHSLSGHPSPRREAREGVAAYASAGIGDDRPGIGTLRAHGGDAHGGSETLIAHALRGEGFDASEDGTGRGTPIVPVHAFDARQSDVLQYGEITGPLDTDGHTMAIAFGSKDHGADAEIELSPTLRAGGHSGSHANAGVPPAVAFQECVTGVREYADAGTLRAGGPGHDPVGTRLRIGSAVRRLTPRECERLQGFPDDYTLIPWRGGMASDGPRYKALGNSMAVPCMAWLGQRIQAVEDLIAAQGAADVA